MKLFSSLKSKNNRTLLIFIGSFAIVGLAVLISALAATAPNAKVAEGESSSSTTNTQVLPDTAASGGNYLQFNITTNTPPPDNERPTRNNTGPRYSMTDITPSQFYSSRTCNKQRIVGSVDFDKQTMLAQTFTLTDCEITGSLGVYLKGGGVPLTLSEMPIINMDYVDINGGMFPLNATKLTMNHTYVASHSQWTVTDVFANGLTYDAPYLVMNSVFYGAYVSQPAHTEAIHISSGKGMQFINVSFEQQGGALANSGVTATINFHGVNALFDGCWFIFDGPIPTHYTAYLDAGDSVVKNSHFESGSASYIYPSSPLKPTFQNNFDFNTGQPISL